MPGKYDNLISIGKRGKLRAPMRTYEANCGPPNGIFVPSHEILHTQRIGAFFQSFRKHTKRMNPAMRMPCQGLKYGENAGSHARRGVRGANHQLHDPLWYRKKVCRQTDRQGQGKKPQTHRQTDIISFQTILYTPLQSIYLSEGVAHFPLLPDAPPS